MHSSGASHSAFELQIGSQWVSLPLLVPRSRQPVVRPKRKNADASRNPIPLECFLSLHPLSNVKRDATLHAAVLGLVVGENERAKFGSPITDLSQ